MAWLQQGEITSATANRVIALRDKEFTKSLGTLE